jgi:hypothetical protein
MSLQGVTHEFPGNQVNERVAGGRRHVQTLTNISAIFPIYLIFSEIFISSVGNFL